MGWVELISKLKLINGGENGQGYVAFMEYTECLI